MDVLEKIVSLILQDPFLTAAEIARRLGYSEEKTVYYWIEKAHYSSLVAFKRAVLSGQYQPPSAQEQSPHYGLLPIIRGFSRDGSPLLTENRYHGMAAFGDIRYAWQYDGPTQWVIMAGDWLLLAPVRNGQTDLRGWCVAFDQDGSTLIRVVLSASEGSQHLVIPETYHADASAAPRYLIRYLFRSLE